VERWTTEETIPSRLLRPKLGGGLVTKWTKLLDDNLTPDYVPPNELQNTSRPKRIC
jgi:hypothetical protein